MEEAGVKFPDDAFFRGDEIVLTPAGPVSGKENTWRDTYLTDAETPDGPYTGRVLSGIPGKRKKG